MVAGDFNGHIGCPDIKQRSCTNIQGQLLIQLMGRSSLYPVTLSSLKKGPKYTFFRDDTKSLIDLVLLSAIDAFLTKKSEILQHHPLNTSDHLPVKIEAKWSTEGNDTSPPPRKVNWTKVIEESLIKEYAKKVEDIIRPLTGIPYPSIKAPEVEIRTIASKIQQLSHTAFPYWSGQGSSPLVNLQGAKKG